MASSYSLASIMQSSSLFILVLFMCTFPFHISAQTLTASLDYGTFEGAYSSKYNISYWQKIPFAAPPIGNNRFRAPQPPSPINGTYNSTQTFPACPQKGVSPPSKSLIKPRTNHTIHHPRPSAQKTAST